MSKKGPLRCSLPQIAMISCLAILLENIKFPGGERSTRSHLQWSFEKTDDGITGADPSWSCPNVTTRMQPIIVPLPVQVMHNT